MELDINKIKADFPLLSRIGRSGIQLVYLDSAATSQKPAKVLEAVEHYYKTANGNAHRGAHLLAELATQASENARLYIANFLGAKPEELSYTLNATASLNLIALSFANASAGLGGAKARQFALKPGDEILVTQAEHHSNLIPWQNLAAKTGATLRWLDVNRDGVVCLDQLDNKVNAKTKIIAFSHVSNVTGSVVNVSQVVKSAKNVGAYTVLDATQSAAHLSLDLHQLEVDFAAFSAHKMYGPLGVGGLYVKSELGAVLPPAFYGGSMVEIVTMEKSTFLPPPSRFEAGTQPIAEAVGWQCAVEYLNKLGMDNILGHEHVLTSILLKGLEEINGVTVLGSKNNFDRLGVISFVLEGVHPHDVSQYLDEQGIEIRVGHHCAQPLHRALGITASCRVSLGLYNDKNDVERFLSVLSGVKNFFS